MFFFFPFLPISTYPFLEYLFTSLHDFLNFIIFLHFGGGRPMGQEQLLQPKSDRQLFPGSGPVSNRHKYVRSQLAA